MLGTNQSTTQPSINYLSFSNLEETYLRSVSVRLLQQTPEVLAGELQDMLIEVPRRSFKSRVPHSRMSR
jgi:hypothetical protein